MRILSELLENRAGGGISEVLVRHAPPKEANCWLRDCARQELTHEKAEPIDQRIDKELAGREEGRGQSSGGQSGGAACDWPR